MRSFQKFFALPLLLAACAGARAQTVSVTGSVVSVDSARANVVITSRGTQKQVNLPANIPIHYNSATGRTMTLDNLTPGTRVSMDADKDPNGALTARSIVIYSANGTLPHNPTTPANQQTVTPNSGSRGGVARMGRPARNVGTAPVGMGGTGGGGAAAIEAAQNTINGQSLGEVRVNGHTVFRFRGTGTANPYLRAREVARRLNGTGMQGLQPSEVRSVRTRYGYAVSARGVVLITADAASARTNGTTPAQLVRRWVSNMRNQLSAS